jgi:hypothetical protein
MTFLMIILLARVSSGQELLITEILYDPDPAILLPPYEFVEWHNPGRDTVNLSGWQWVVGDKVKRLTQGRILPGDFAIICSPAAAPAFSPFGPVIPVESFPTLRNTGDILSLVNAEGLVVHRVSYSPSQFTDPIKANGGWSLELADINHYCNPNAWMPALDPSGGTPGRMNSQQVDLPDSEPIILLRAAIFENNLMVLHLSGPTDPGLNMNNYSCLLKPGDIKALAVTAPNPGLTGLFFSYPTNIDRSLLYTVDLIGEVTDCSGREVIRKSVLFGFPSESDSSDVVITEVMFDPAPGQTEFVEVFNQSGKVIELGNLILARGDPDGTIIAYSDKQAESYLLFPDSYAVITDDPVLFTSGWPASDPSLVAVRSDLPSLTNAESSLILMTSFLKVVDFVKYSPDWHYPYLDETKGVSLERINYKGTGIQAENWFSASSASGFSTPGLVNSASLVIQESSDDHFSLINTLGYAENYPDKVLVAVNYQFDEAGWFFRLGVYNAGGLPVRELSPFGMAGINGMLTWDGLDDARRIAPDGIYLMVADYFHPSGKKGRWKRACAVVRAH